MKAVKQILLNRDVIDGNASSSHSQQQQQQHNEETLSGAEAYFNEFFGDRDDSSIIVKNYDNEAALVLQEIKKNISLVERQRILVNPIEYYSIYKFSHPIVYELALVVFSGPGTQVTVERAFNYLKLLVTDTRNQLAPKTVENILFINLNRELLGFVDFENMNMK